MTISGALSLAPCTLSLAGVDEAARVEQWRRWMEHMVDIDVPRRGGPFFGSLTAYNVGGVVMSYCESASMTVIRGLERISRDGLDYCMLQFVLSGGHGRIVSGTREMPSGPGDIMLMDYGRPIAVERNTYSALGLFVPKAMLAPHLPTTGQHVCMSSSEQALAATAADWALALFRRMPCLDEQQAGQALASLLPLLAASLGVGERTADMGNGRSAARRRHVLDYIHTHRDDPDLDVAQVLAHFGMSRAQLYRLFADDPGGPAALIRQYRLRAALEDVMHRQDLSIAQIAYAAGFATPASFSTAFRRMYRASPLQLRRQARPLERGRPPVLPAAYPYQPHFPPAG